MLSNLDGYVRVRTVLMNRTDLRTCLADLGALTRQEVKAKINL